MNLRIMGNWREIYVGGRWSQVGLLEPERSQERLSFSLIAVVDEIAEMQKLIVNWARKVET